MATPIRLVRTKKTAPDGSQFYAIRYGNRFSRVWLDSCWAETLLCGLNGLCECAEDEGEKEFHLSGPPTEAQYHEVRDAIHSADLHHEPIYSSTFVPASGKTPAHLVFTCLDEDVHWDLKLVATHPLANKSHVSPHDYTIALGDFKPCPIVKEIRSALSGKKLVESLVKDQKIHPLLSAPLLRAAIDDANLPRSVADFRLDINDGTLRGTFYDDNGDPLLRHHPRSTVMALLMLTDKSNPFFIGDQFDPTTLGAIDTKVRDSALPRNIHTLDSLAARETIQTQQRIRRLFASLARELSGQDNK